MNEFRVLVCGGRNYGRKWNGTEWVDNQQEIDNLNRTLNRSFEAATMAGKQFVLVHGGTRGADQLSHLWASMREERDTLKYAMKASARCDANGVWHDVFKDPITDKGKQSKKGRLGLVHEHGLGSHSYRTLPKSIADQKDNLLRPVYRNGNLLVDDDFETVRGRAALHEEEYVLHVVERY